MYSWHALCYLDEANKLRNTEKTMQLPRHEALDPNLATAQLRNLGNRV
jgi:hypothetical protein